METKKIPNVLRTTLKRDKCLFSQCFCMNSYKNKDGLIEFDIFPEDMFQEDINGEIKTFITAMPVLMPINIAEQKPYLIEMFAFNQDQKEILQNIAIQLNLKPIKSEAFEKKQIAICFEERLERGMEFKSDEVTTVEVEIEAEDNIEIHHEVISKGEYISEKL